MSTFVKLALKKCNETSPMWSIHGLWMDYSNGTWPQYCSHMNFEPLPEYTHAVMNEQWYSCGETTNHDFWSHELEKHGSCIRDLIDPWLTSTDYFNITIVFFQMMLPHLEYLCKKGLECYIKYFQSSP